MPSTTALVAVAVLLSGGASLSDAFAPASPEFAGGIADRRRRAGGGGGGHASSLPFSGMLSKEVGGRRNDPTTTTTTTSAVQRQRAGGGRRKTAANNNAAADDRFRLPALGMSSVNDPVIGPASTRQKKKDLKTFPRYLEVECWRRSELRDLQPVLLGVGEACRQINRIVQRAQTDDLYGDAVSGVDEDGNPLDGTNVQGEVQQKLDVVCNTIMLKQFCGCSSAIAAVASEEEDLPRMCDDVMNDSAFSVGDYVAVFDPLDGSKNIDASLPVGTIFGIYKKEAFQDEVTPETFLQRGSDSLVAAGYCLYSATTVLVLTLGSGVDGFTLDPDKSSFLHTHEDIRIPPSGPIYSFNEANFHDFSYPVRRYLNALKEGSSSVGKRSNARYVGALVADVHNVLINGGIYGYPSTRANANGKLRLLYESNPMAMIVEQAGGAASTGNAGRILDVKPTDIHQRVPTFLGSVENVFELDQFHTYYEDEE
uniref:Fructose-1,6-bisphosphatase, cytosolic n=1 Tax=Odontella aurita TaxID=265563 RepID=A0A7S4JJB5_9STRA|mmetsp:Transcript_4731/g.13328  ORF Transcript_4731/g.13328 Transcript_4731/m.13328 type:complete len:482 (+) Transcript_4731:83-1528(+)